MKPTKFLAHPRMYQTTHELQSKLKTVPERYNIGIIADKAPVTVLVVQYLYKIGQSACYNHSCLMQRR